MTQADQARLLTPDVLRGVAVLGILAVNITAFALPGINWFNPDAYQGRGAADAAAWFLTFVFFEGKMRGLLSLLFGAGVVMICDRAERDGLNAARALLPRLAVLALFGLLHFYLLWHGDILFLYAVTGVAVFFLRHVEEERLIVLALLLYACGALIQIFALYGPFLMLELAAARPDASAAALTAWRELMADPYFTGQAAADEGRALTGGFADGLVYRWTVEGARPFRMVQDHGIETISFMLLGAALIRNGFLAGDWPAVRYRRWAAGLFWPALLVSLILAAIVMAAGFGPVWTINATMGWAWLPRLPMVLGYAAILILIAHAASSALLVRALAAAGRMSLTNYLGASILMTALFYGWGLGLFGQYGRAQLWLFIIPAWAAMLLGSLYWQGRFGAGPFERLWQQGARLLRDICK